MPKTKILCTIGPASASSETLRALIESGMNVARLNFSHGTLEGHRRVIRRIRRLSEQLGRPVAILQDLCGPKIRVGPVREPGVRLETGRTLLLTSEPVLGDARRVSVSYPDLVHDVKEGDRILLADGMMELEVTGKEADGILCKVVTGGVLTSNKGITVPTGSVTLPSLTEKDIEDLRFGMEVGVDWVALSFVRSAEDVLRAKKIISEGQREIPVMAKIEKHEAITHIDAIIEAADGLMVARGDLGVELAPEKVPLIQKKVVQKANAGGKPVVIATQMLRSMVDSPRPTRAEAADVANAVLDGADAVMLSEETAVGKYPDEAVRFMARIAESAESDYPHERHLRILPREGVSRSVAHAACVLAGNLGAAAIVASTHSGATAMQISRFRPKTKVIAISPDPGVARRLALFWGCITSTVEHTEDLDEMIENAMKSSLATGEVRRGDLVIFTAGHPMWVAGTTNMVQVKTL